MAPPINSLVLILAQEGQFSFTDLFSKLAAGASALALLGLLLVIPLYLTQRREVRRLLIWQKLEPERGEGEGSVPSHPQAAGYAAAAHPPTGELTPAQRVTAERPALERITAERAALPPPPWWRRLLIGGPRHPLVLALAALLLAGGVVAVVALTRTVGVDLPERGGGLDRAEVPVVVLNGASRRAIAGKLADVLAAAGFTRVETGASGSSNQTVVLFGPRRKREANVVARELGVKVIQPIDRPVRALAPDANVIVVAGEDQVRRR